MSAAKPKPCARCGSTDIAICHETLEHPMKSVHCICYGCMRYGPRVISGICGITLSQADSIAISRWNDCN